MSAASPDIRVLAIGLKDAARRLPRIHEWLAEGSVPVLCGATADAVAAMEDGCERDVCSPGVVVRALGSAIGAGELPPADAAREMLVRSGWTPPLHPDGSWVHDEGEAVAYMQPCGVEFVGGYPVGAAELLAFAALLRDLEAQP